MFKRTFEKLRKNMMKENKIYIFPTGRGFLFLGTMVIITLTGATYNNNLVFILAFILFSVFSITMLQTHYILKGVRINFIGAEEGFEKNPLGLFFQIEQSRERTKKGLIVRPRTKIYGVGRFEAVDLRPEEHSKTVRVEIWPPRRGVHPVNEMILETHYPMGLFRAWKIFRPSGQFVVYPSPEGLDQKINSSLNKGDHEQGVRNTPDGDFGELRVYRSGESYHQIAWKHYARTGSLYSRVLWGDEHKHYRIPWRPGLVNFELYLKQMSHWIQQALAEGASFEMETPEGHIEVGLGEDHARKCWRLLATLNEKT